jgi:hypothetical protein
MEPKTEDIKKLAIYDPVAAYGILLGIPRVPLVANHSVTFSSFALNQAPIAKGLDTTFAYRTWIESLTYSVTPIGQFSGNIFQTMYVANLRAATGVSVRASVHAGPRYLVAQQFTPLENFVNIFHSNWPCGWPLFKQQNILAEFLLTAVPGGDDSNLSAYSVTLSWSGWQFLDPSLEDMSGDQARKCLRDCGIWTPDGCTKPGVLAPQQFAMIPPAPKEG